MRLLSVVLLGLLSFSVSAVEMVYQGNDAGASCTLTFDFLKNYASLGGCSFSGSNKIFRNEKVVIFEGSTENEDCKIEIELSENDYPHIIPMRASLFKKNLLKPLYQRELRCTELKRVR